MTTEAERKAELLAARRFEVFRITHRNATEAGDLIVSLDARIAELEAQQQWIPVGTLPAYTKDTPCIVASHGGIFVDDWEPEYQEFEQTNKTATHWMPLPTPPTENMVK